MARLARKPGDKVQPAKRRTGRSAKAKGTRGEKELVEFLTHYGIPSQRVLASGAFRGAKADVKVGIALNPDGTMPDEDETRCILRAEVKNRKDNPEQFFKAREEILAVLLEARRHGTETVWGHMNQEAITKATVLRRAKVPQGAIAAMDGNQVFAVVMGLEDWAELFLKAYGEELNAHANRESKGR